MLYMILSVLVQRS